MSESLPNSDAVPPRQALVVLGMHRSGTSVVAGTLRELGIDFGPRLMPPTPANPHGYFEHIDIVNLHDRLLLALGGSWDETGDFLPPGWADDPRAKEYKAQVLNVLRRDFPIGSGGPWGLKDPRLCRLLPWWDDLWPQAGVRPAFVLVARSSAEVADSLTRREGFSRAKGLLLWLIHTLEAERFSRGKPRVFLDYRIFLRNPVEALDEVRSLLGGSWPKHPDQADSLIDPFLSKGASASADAVLPVWVRKAEAALAAYRQGGAEADLRGSFDTLYFDLAAGKEVFAGGGSGTTDDLRLELEASRKQARWYEAEWKKASRRADAAAHAKGPS